MNSRKSWNLTIGIIAIISGIVFIVLGIVNYDFFREFLCVIIGIGMIVTNIPAVIFSLYSLGYDKKRNLMLILVTDKNITRVLNTKKGIRFSNM